MFFGIALRKFARANPTRREPRDTGWRDLAHIDPLVTRITEVSSDAAEDGTIMVTVDLGTRDGLRMNMPLMSEADAQKTLYGWVWRPNETSCGVGIQLNEEDPGDNSKWPSVGDVLTTRVS